MKTIARGAPWDKSNIGWCAREVGDSLGYRTGDAAKAGPALRSHGWVPMPKGTKPRIDDIAQYKFSYGSKNSQHLGFVGLQHGEVVLISDQILPYQEPDVLWRHPQYGGQVIEGTGRMPKRPTRNYNQPQRRVSSLVTVTPGERTIPKPPPQKARTTKSGSITKAPRSPKRTLIDRLTDRGISTF